jgi:TPR repeat protein
VLLFEIFIDDLDGNSFKDLEAILDRVTPLYKHRLDNLSTQQQAIIDAIAQNWDAVSTKEIAAKVRMPSKAVSSQLNQLEKNQLVKKIPTSTKNLLYQINERFFNIYYLMRLGKRRNRNRVLWLVKFFEICCGEKELVERTKRHIKAIQEGRLYDKYALYISLALSKTHIPYDLQHELLDETKKFLTSQKSAYVNDVDQSHIDVLRKVIEYVKKKDINKARKELENDGFLLIQVNKIMAQLLKDEGDLTEAIKFYKEAIKSGDTAEMFNLALLYDDEIKDFEKAEQYYKMAVEKGDTDAMFNLALLYKTEFKDFEKAEQYYRMAVKKSHSGAIFNLALLYQTEFKDFENAEQYYKMAVKKGHSGAMHNLAMLYQTEFKDFEKAEKYYKMAIKKGHSGAMHNLAMLYQTEFKDFEKAEQYYKMAVEKGDSGAMFNLALLYDDEFKDFEKVEQYYKMAVEKGHSSAMHNLALLYQTEFKDFEKAEQYYKMAVEKGDSKAMYNLALLYDEEFKDFEKAEKYYEMAVEKDDSEAMNNLARLYFQLNKNNQEALHLQKAAYERTRDINTANGYMTVLLWNDEIQEATMLFESFFDSEEVQREVNEDISYILLMLMAKKQYSFVYKVFQKNRYDIRDKYKPIYYALLSLMGEKYSDELKRMGDELKESVQDILHVINTLKKDFAK